MSRRREPRRAQASHTDDWLITYADTITLLLCLFVLLLASQAHTLELAQTRIAAAPPDRGAVTANDWKPRFEPVTPEPEVAGNNAYAETEERTTAPHEEIISLPTEGAADIPGAQRPPADPPPLVAIVTDPAQALQPASGVPLMLLPEMAAGPDFDEPAQVEPRGDRITTFAFDSAAFFDRGSATLSRSGKVILQQVVGNLKSEEYRDYMTTIEGHTDDVPISTAQFPSNWELSSARAAAVARFFVEQGVSAQRLRAAGYADTQPLRPNRDSTGVALPDNQAKNRRVVIELEKIERH